MGTIDTLLRVKADAAGAVRGLKPLETSLKEIADESKDAEKSLKDLGDKHTVHIDDGAIDRAQREIKRLREQMRSDLRMDVSADTREAQRRIRALRSTVRELEREDIDLDVNVDTSQIRRLESAMGGIGKVGSKLPGVLRAVGGAAAAATFGLSGIAVGAGTAVVAALKLSDEMANAKIAFTQFLGTQQRATKFLDDLSKFAAKTPFEFSDLVESSKRLLAFGIQGEDVVDIMTTLGDAAALTGAEVADLTTIWGQMAAKGKLSNEELLQFTEHGIPAYQLLADAMGKTVPEIQKMAEKGLLLSTDVLPLLQQRMDATFGGGMAKQAKTLSGIWSTMVDSLSAVGRTMGDAFAPVVSEQIGNLTGKLEEFGRWASENKEFLVTSFSAMAATMLDFAADIALAFQGIINSAAAMLDTFARLEKVIKVISPAAALMFRDTDFAASADQLRTVGDGLGEISDGLRNSAKEAKATGEKWAQSFRQSDAIQRIKNDLTDVNDYIKELRSKPPTAEIQLKIDKALNKRDELRNALRDEEDKQHLVTIDVKIEKGTKTRSELQQSLAYLKTLKPTVEVKAKIEETQAALRKVRENLKELRLRKLRIPITADIKDAQDKADRIKRRLDRLKDMKPTAKVTADITEAQEKLDRIKRRIERLKEMRANPEIKPFVEKSSRDHSESQLDETAKGKGKGGRKAPIKPAVDPTSKKNTNKELNTLARDRNSYVNVFYRLMNNPPIPTTGGGGGGGGGRAAIRAVEPLLAGAAPRALAADSGGSMMAAGRALRIAAPAAAAAAPRQVERMAPRQTPVAVYLDGAQIADHLELRSKNLAAVSAVRNRSA